MRPNVLAQRPAAFGRSALERRVRLHHAHSPHDSTRYASDRETSGTVEDKRKRALSTIHDRRQRNYGRKREPSTCQCPKDESSGKGAGGSLGAIGLSNEAFEKKIGDASWQNKERGKEHRPWNVRSQRLHHVRSQVGQCKYRKEADELLAPRNSLTVCVQVKPNLK